MVKRFQVKNSLQVSMPQVSIGIHRYPYHSYPYHRYPYHRKSKEPQAILCVNLAFYFCSVCVCDPPLGVLDEVQRRKKSCKSPLLGCTKHKQCGRDGWCIIRSKECPKSRYDDIFTTEETGPSMEIDNLESDVELEMDQPGRMVVLWGKCCCNKPKGTYHYTTLLTLCCICLLFRHASFFAVNNGNHKN